MNFELIIALVIFASFLGIFLFIITNDYFLFKKKMENRIFELNASFINHCEKPFHKAINDNTPDEESQVYMLIDSARTYLLVHPNATTREIMSNVFDEDD